MSDAIEVGGMTEADAEAQAEPGSLAALAKLIGWPQVVALQSQVIADLRAERDRLKDDLRLARNAAVP